MKRAAALFLALALLLSASSAMADFDLSHLKENPQVFSVTETDLSTFVSSQMNAEQLFFTHPYESESMYSFTYFSLWLPAGMDKIWPVLKVFYASDRPINMTGISFEVGGVQYTFTGELHELEEEEDGITEDIAIFFGPENLDFLAALETYVDEDNLESLLSTPISAVIHGDEDLAVTLNEAFMLDFYVVIEMAMFDLGGLDKLAEGIASEMVTSEIGVQAH